MAVKRKGIGIAAWVLSALLAAVFVMAGMTKITGAQQHVEHFSKWGYPDWFRILIGAAEVLGAMAILVPRLSLFATGGLAVIILGAVYTHVRNAEGTQAIVPAVILILLALVAYLRRTPGGTSHAEGETTHH